MNTLEIPIDCLNVLDGERLVKTVKPRIFLQLLLIDFQFLTQFSHHHFIFFGNFDLERKPAPDALRLNAVDDFLNFLPREFNRLSRVKSSWFGEVESLIEAEMDAAYLVTDLLLHRDVLGRIFFKVIGCTAFIV